MKASIIVNCCYEGFLLKRSLDSAIRSVEASGFAEECEIIAVADCANKTTLRVLEDYESRLTRVLHTNFADLGSARNAGAAVGCGELALFLDGDDLWSRNWVGAAWSEFVNSPLQTILHPQFCIFFGARAELLVQPDWRDSYFDPRGISARNHWISLCAIRRDLLRELPFPVVDRARKFGFEDWSWYAGATARGFRHATVPGTSHFIRLKVGPSMMKKMSDCYCVPSLEFAEFMAIDDPTRPLNL